MPSKSKPKKLKPSRHFNLFWQYPSQTPDTRADSCPYCHSREVLKRGRRQKKHEAVQLYFCKACEKTFTPQIVKHKHYPLGMILDAVSLYNLGYTRNETCQLVREKYGPRVKPATLTKWIEELAPLCRYARFRDLAQERYRTNWNIAAVWGNKYFLITPI
jgi:transposase-like protein